MTSKPGRGELTLTDSALPPDASADAKLKQVQLPFEVTRR